MTLWVTERFTTVKSPINPGNSPSAQLELLCGLEELMYHLYFDRNPSEERLFRGERFGSTLCQSVKKIIQHGTPGEKMTEVKNNSSGAQVYGLFM